MPSLKEIHGFMDTIAPPELAEDWDNPGLLVNCGGDVERVLVALDITPDVVAEAEEKGCGLVVAHHPVIFAPLHRVEAGSVVFSLVQKGISALCAHTNLDTAEGGVNDVLCGLLGVEGAQPFADYGRVGKLPAAETPQGLARHCARVLDAHVQLADCGRPVETVAVVGGSGKHLVEEAAARGVDCLITGEADHHDILDAKAAGITLVIAGHYATETPVRAALAAKLRERFPGLAVCVSEAEKDPVEYFQ